MKKRIAASLTAIILLISCSDLLVENNQVNKNMADFEAAWKLANDIYPFFEFKKIRWDSLYIKYKPLAQKAAGDEIYDVLFNMFRELKDGHIEVHTNGGYMLPTYMPQRYFNDRKSFSQNVVSSYLGKELKLAGSNNISYEIADNIGYTYFSTFTEGNWINDFDRVLDYLKETKGMIIDLRNNGGGNAQVYTYVIARYITSRVSYTIYRKNGQPNSYTINPGGYFKYLKPVVILVNGASFSAAEHFPELLRQLNNVTVVGDTTGGGGGAIETDKLPSGKRIKIPHSYFTRLDGSMVEWRGSVPDIIVEQTETDKNNWVDKQLAKAFEILKNK